jgi:phosphate transport system substrate-binding protein
MKIRVRERARLKITTIMFVVAATIIQLSCYYKGGEVQVLKIKGSDTMLRLTTMLANEFMKNNPEISIYVDGGGTRTGIESLAEGKIDICTASRNPKPEEIQEFAKEFGSIGISTLIAKDALSVYLNPKNPIKNLTTEQLREIFTCKVTNWKQIGGNDLPIKIIIRSTNSGTHLYFKEHVLQMEEYCDKAEIKSTTEEIVREVAVQENAIGYGGIGFNNGIFHAMINNIEPTEENVRDEKYPISRYLMFMTLNTPSGISKKFIDWVLSQEGQDIIQKSGFISIWKR